MTETIAPPAPAAESAPSSAASGLVAALSSLNEEAPASAASSGNDFLSKFNADLPEPEATKVEEPVKTEEASKAEATTDDEEDTHGEAPDPKDAKANEKWVSLKGDLKKTRAELRAERDRVAGELGSRDSEIATLKESKATLEREIAELAQVKERAARVDEVEKELSVHRVESSDLYKRSVTEPLNAISDRLEQIAKDNGIDADSLFDAVGEPDFAKQRAALNEILPGLGVTDQLFVSRAVDDTRGILAKRDQIRADAANARKELEAKQTAEAARTKEAAQKELLGEFDRVGENIKKRMPFVELAKGETADGVFAAALKEAKETDFDNLTPGTKAFMATSGILLARLIKQSQSREAYIKTLEGRVKEDNSAAPSVEGKENVVTTEPGSKGKSFRDDMAGFLGQSSQSHSGFVKGG